jgi:hypothetical protein
LHDIEEDIWSPKWGLKGKVDASVQASIGTAPTQPGEEVEEHVAPLEIKTGRAIGVMAHRAQTMLYTLLMEDRYGRSNAVGKEGESWLTGRRRSRPSWTAILFKTRLHPPGGGSA